MTDEIEVTVLLPCLNEAETLASCVEKALACLERLGVRGEVLVSDNGSADGSQDIGRAHGARVVHAPIRGYGGALIAGIEAARGKYVIMADADDSYDLTNLGPFLEQLRAGNDIVMGNRFRGGIAPGAMPLLHRYLGNPVLSWIGRFLFDLKQVGDFHCGIRGFDRARILALDLRMPGMEFASELVVRAALAGYTIVEVPASLQPDGRSRKPHLRTWHDGWRHLRFLLVFAPKITLVVPGALLTMLGLASTVALLAGPVTIGGLQFDNAALVYSCLAVLVGVQLLLVGGCAKLYTGARSLASAPRSLWRRVMSLEVLSTLGLLLVLGGLAGTGVGLSLWQSRGFGRLNAGQIIHVVVPSATTIAIGIGAVFTGLLASLLTLDRVPPGARAQPTPEPPAEETAGGRTSEDLFHFGRSPNGAEPLKGARYDDFGISNDSDDVGPYSPSAPTDEVGAASTYIDAERSGLSGRYYRLPAGTELPDVLGVHADGEDVGAGALGSQVGVPNNPDDAPELGVGVAGG